MWKKHKISVQVALKLWNENTISFKLCNTNTRRVQVSPK